MSEQQRAAMQAALEALESLQGGCTDSGDGTVEAITVWCPEVIDALRAALAEPQPTFRRGDLVRKRSGSAWQGRVVGEYSTALTPDGYAVESDCHPGSVQIYPAKALEAAP